MENADGPIQMKWMVYGNKYIFLGEIFYTYFGEV